MKNTLIFRFVVLMGFFLLIALMGCQQSAPEKSEDALAEDPASSSQPQEAEETAPVESQAFQEDSVNLQEQVEQQQQKLMELELKLKQQEENARLREDLKKQKEEMEELKRRVAQQEAARKDQKEAQVKASTEGQKQEAMAKKQPEQGKRPERRVSGVVVPEETPLVVGLQGSLSTLENQPGDEFDTYLEKSIKVDEEVVFPADTLVRGVVVDCRPSGKVKGKAEMTIRLKAIKYKGNMMPLKSNSLQFIAEGSTTKDAAIIGGGGGVGALIGGLIGGKKGAAIGALIGAGGGTAVVLKTSGKEVEFRPETRFQFILTRPLSFKK